MPRSGFAAANRRFTNSWIGRHPTSTVAAAVMAAWLWAILGPESGALVVLATLAVAAVRFIRTRRDTALSLLAAVAGVAVPLTGAVLAADTSTPPSTALAAVLTGYAVAGAVPALVAVLLRHPARPRAPLAVIGTAVYLAGGVPTAVFGAHRWSSTLLPVGLIVGSALIWRMHRTAVARRCRPATPFALDGWSDLGQRRTEKGLTLHRLIVGTGGVLPCWHCPSAHPGKAALVRTLGRGVDVAKALTARPDTVQPVLLVPGDTAPSRTQVTTAQASGVVIVVGQDRLDELLAAAPDRPCRRRALRKALRLPTV